MLLTFFVFVFVKTKFLRVFLLFTNEIIVYVNQLFNNEIENFTINNEINFRLRKKKRYNKFHVKRIFK